MIRTKKRLRICIILVVLNLTFIWGNSILPGSISGAISEWVKHIMELIFNRPSSEPGTSSFWLRKLAHFSEFACLGVLLAWFYGMMGHRRMAGFFLPLLSGFGAALTDEFIQLFSDGRHASLVDITIDTAGAAAGIALLLTAFHFWLNIRIRHRSCSQC